MLTILYDPSVKTVRIILRAYNAAFLMLTFFLSTLGPDTLRVVGIHRAFLIL